MMYSLLDAIDKLNLDGTLLGDKTSKFSCVSSLFDSKKGSITFCTAANVEKLREAMPSIHSSVIILPKDITIDLPDLKNRAYFLVDNPMEVFIKIVDSCLPTVRTLSGIHPTAIITDAAHIGKNVAIAPYCTIGFEGFGFIHHNGDYRNFPHYGNVIIEDDVEIFPFTNVDKGALTDTVIGRGTKIDHHCHIGHNVHIGKNCIITAGVIIAGSTIIGDNVYIGIGSLIRDWLHIGDNAVIGMGSVVTKDVSKNAVVYGNPATIHKKKAINR